MQFTNGNKISWIDDLRSDLTMVQDKVTKACKNSLSQGCEFVIDSIDVGIDADNSSVVLKCILVEQKWDIENKKYINDYVNHEFDYYWSTEMISVEELVIALYTHCEVIDFR